MLGFNGIPVLKFDGPDWMINWLNYIDLPQPITVHVIAAATPVPGYGAKFIGSFSAADIQIVMAADGTLYFSAGTGAGYAVNTDQHMITAVFNGASSVQRIDGVQVGTVNTGTGGLARVQIGQSHNLTDMTICEIAFYNRVLTGPEIAYNEDLLTKKWWPPAGTWTRSPAKVTITAAARTWYTGTAPAFRPDYIEDCTGWWDASDATTFSYSSGVSVSRWRDKTAFVSDFTAPSSGDEPDRTGTINGLPVVSFDGAAWLNCDVSGTPPVAAMPAQPSTIFAVASVNTGAFYGVFAGSNGAQVRRHGGTGQLSFDAGVAAGYPLDAAPHLITAIFDRRSSEQRIDGLQVGTADTGVNDIGAFRVGTNNDSGNKMVGKIAEVCFYARHLTSTEITEVEAYLMAKWFGPPPPQTWTGSSATLTVTATSGAWALVAPQTWTRSAATLTITATSGTWSVASASAFKPSDIAGIAGWGDASIGAHFQMSGSNVEYWGDTASPCVFSRQDTTALVIGTSHGLPAVVFAANDNWMLGRTGRVQVNYNAGNKPYTVVVYVEFTGPPGEWSVVTGASGCQMGLYGYNDEFHWDAGSSTHVPITRNALHTIGGVFNGASSSQWLDGVKVGTVNPGGTDHTEFWIGSPGNKPQMKLVRFAFYKAALNDTQMGQLMTWLVSG
jgi:hypothetical protein